MTRADVLRDLARAKVAFQLRAIETIIRGPASADTHAKRGDAKQAPSERMGSAVAEGQTPDPDHPMPDSTPMTHDELVDDHERIWLQPRSIVDEGEGRQWCEDDVWDDDGSEPSTEYVRADTIEQMREEIAVLREALERVLPWAEVCEPYNSKQAEQQAADIAEARTALNRTLPPIAETKE